VWPTVVLGHRFLGGELDGLRFARLGEEIRTDEVIAAFVFDVEVVLCPVEVLPGERILLACFQSKRRIPFVRDFVG